MLRLVALLPTCALFALPATMPAQNATLTVCNKGPLPINIAYAARIQLFITGYRWETSGWYVVDAGACKLVYDESYDDAGPITPQSGARIVMIAQTNGTWRAFNNTDGDKQGWMQSGTGQICADANANSGFRYQEPAGDPAATCSSNMRLPVAFDFMPTGPCEYTYDMHWDGGAPSVAVGTTAPSTDVAAAPTAAPTTASAITYFCSSTDKQPVIYVSDFFDLPDAGSKADNFITFERTQLHFQMFLVTHYDYSGDDGLVACVYAPTTATSAAEMAAKKQSLTAALAAANKHVIETAWKYTPADVTSDTVFVPVTEGDAETLTPNGRGVLFSWVRQDVASYLAASKTGFDAYKSGDVILSQGYRMWTSSVKPTAARGCWVVQGDSTTTLSCAIPINKDYERAYYDALVQDVAASLPADWSTGPANPFGGELPSTGFRSTSGAHGEVWLVAPTADTYELNFQLVSAPVRH